MNRKYGKLTALLRKCPISVEDAVKLKWHLKIHGGSLSEHDPQVLQEVVGIGNMFKNMAAVGCLEHLSPDLQFLQRTVPNLMAAAGGDLGGMPRYLNASTPNIPLYGRCEKIPSAAANI